MWTALVIVAAAVDPLQAVDASPILSATVNANVETPLLAALKKVEVQSAGLVSALQMVQKEAKEVEEGERRSLATIAAKNGELSGQLAAAQATIKEQEGQECPRRPRHPASSAVPGSC